MPTSKELADAIRVLSMDAVQQAGSGHPGMPMGMADIAQALWCDHLRHDPNHPDWPDRDRFVLSNGHGSMLLYALLHLSGYDLPIDEIRRFRQLGSSTPGHPEYGDTPGVETTTGPLGQGLANAVGMAIAERVSATRFNRPGHEVVDHRTWVFLGDGCLMEGISHEACSLAGTLGLGKLIGVYDDNAVSIDGEVKGWFTDDTPARFEAYGWHVVQDVDGHDAAAVNAAIAAAKAVSDRPSLLCCKTIIGFGSPGKQGDASAHGAPLGVEEVERARAFFGWTHPPFEIPAELYAAWDARAEGEKRYRDWQTRFESYRAAFPEDADEFKRRTQGLLPPGWDAACANALAAVDAEALSIASRQASLKALEALGPMLPELIGGSADLTGSNLSRWSGSRVLSRTSPEGNYLYFGVREFAMSAIATGLALHGGFIPYCATFLVFSEYARNALRMAALMGQRVIFVFTHDSIGLGEDGPTHQAVEQTASLRLIPGMSVWRPCDAVESMVAWQAALERRDGPTCLIFSRQGLAHQERSPDRLADIRRGAHILRDGGDALLIATGSEVGIAMDAAASLDREGVSVRVVSMTSVDRFEAQDEAYRASVLPPSQRARVAIEAGVRSGWRAWVGEEGAVVGVDDFGKSAPWKDVYEHFGLTAEHLAAEVRRTIERTKGRDLEGPC